MSFRLAAFLPFYEAAHRNVANRYVHHVAHLIATIGVLLLWRPLLGISLIAVGFVLSWAGHYFLEKNTPAFFEAPGRDGFGAALAKKVEVALGGLVWSGSCFLRLFNRGPLGRRGAQPTVPAEVADSRRPG
jgi:hypothetical protein